MAVIKKLKYTAIGSFVFLIVYMLIAAVPLRHDLYFQPVWTRTMRQAAIITPEEDGARQTADGTEEVPAPRADGSGMEAFMLGGNLGFFTPDGELFRAETNGMRFSAGADAWCVYPADAKNTAVYDFTGALKMTLEEPGFAHITRNAVYLFHPGGGAVSRYAEDGTKLWTREEISPVTAFAESEAGTVIGYGSGRLTAVDNAGNEIFSFYPGGSDLPVILSAAISRDGKLAACVSGISPQRLILIEINGGQHKIIFHRNLETSLRRQLFTGFGESGRKVFFETGEGLCILDTRSMELGTVPFKGRILTAGEYPGTNFFLTLVKTDTGHTLSLIESPAHKIASTDFNAENAFLILRDGAIYLGSDENISRINIEGIYRE